MSSHIFISYRREDSHGSAGRLYDLLVSHFGRERIFMDVDAIQPGLDFINVIDAAVSKADVFIAVIGPAWLDAKDQTGKRRLDNPEDFVRLEIAAALRRDIRVIPLLFEGAQMPRSIDLPDDLKALSRRNAIEISHSRFHSDAQRLINSLELFFKQAEDDEKRQSLAVSPPKPGLYLPRWSWLITVMVIATGFLLWNIFSNREPKTDEVPGPAVSAETNPADVSLPTAESTQTQSPIIEPTLPSFLTGNILFDDEFDSNKNGWATGERSSDASDANWSIDDGRYQLFMTSHSTASRWSYVPKLTVKDFSLSFNATVVESSGNFSSGHPAVRVTFRENDDKYYRVNFDNDAFRIQFVDGETTTTLVDWTKSNSINLEPGITNAFMITVKGATFSIFANNQLIATVNDDFVTNSGRITIGAALFDANQELTIAFDDLIVRTVP